VTADDHAALADLAAGRAGAGAGLATAFAAAHRAGDRDRADALLDGVAALAAAGSRAAIEVLVGLVHDHHLAAPAIGALLVAPADADDAEQLTLIAVLEHVSSFEGRARFRTWLHRVARNEALMVLRRKQRKAEPSGEPVPDGDAGVRRISSLLADRLTVDQLLAELPDHHREALVLRELEGLEYEEIAARLGVPIGTVRSRIARGREQLARRATRG
jgi:RNA polymerase sigma-70 factor, ECF subfamily